MTEQEWQTCVDPQAMLDWLQSQELISERKARLFGVACCRRVWHRFLDARSHRAIETMEKFIEAQASLEDVKAARLAVEAARQEIPDPRLETAEWAAVALASAPEWKRGIWPSLDSVADAARWAAAEFAELAGKKQTQRKQNKQRGWRSEQLAQCELLRDIVGPLAFRLVALDPPSIAPTWLRWRDGIVAKLAEAAYQERHLPSGHLDPARLAILADCLEEADCGDAELLAELTSPEPRVRGFWALDVLLGKA
jgi:hypothetical protein